MAKAIDTSTIKYWRRDYVLKVVMALPISVAKKYVKVEGPMILPDIPLVSMHYPQLGKNTVLYKHGVIKPTLAGSRLFAFDVLRSSHLDFNSGVVGVGLSRVCLVCRRIGRKTRLFWNTISSPEKPNWVKGWPTFDPSLNVMATVPKTGAVLVDGLEPVGIYVPDKQNEHFENQSFWYETVYPSGLKARRLHTAIQNSPLPVFSQSVLTELNERPLSKIR